MSSSGSGQDGPHVYPRNPKMLPLPLSSPEGEEVASLASPMDSTQVSLNKRSQGGRSGQIQAQPSGGPGRVSNPSKKQSASKRTQEHARSRWPELNIVTSFSRSPTSVQHATSTNAKSSQRTEPTAENARPRYATLLDIKASIDNRENRSFQAHRRNKSQRATAESLDFELCDRSESKTGDSEAPKAIMNQDFRHPGDSSDYDACSFPDSRERVKNPKRSTFKIPELSPSDGPIVIGISIPPARLAEHSESPNIGSMSSNTHKISIDQDAPMTPTIIVTPAKDTAPWNDKHSRFFGSLTESNADPPVPLSGQVHTISKRTNASDINKENFIRTSLDSTETIFDEDNNATDFARPRSNSSESQWRMLNRASIDSVATRHRSQGWWNYIVSPFVTRSNTMFRFGPNKKDHVPTLPSPAQVETSIVEPKDQKVNKTFSGSMRKIEGTEKDRDSTWTDMSSYSSEQYNEYSTLTPLQEASHIDSRQPPTQNYTPPFEGFGAAVEYYKACWHDQGSPTPFFKCENHSCYPSSKSMNNVEAFKMSPEGPNNTRGVLNDDEGAKIHDATHGFQQTPGNRFSAAFRQVTNLKPRPLSEATEVEDLDITPIVHEAHIAPVVRASSPVAAVTVVQPGRTKGPAIRCQVAPVPSPQVEAACNAPLSESSPLPLRKQAPLLAESQKPAKRYVAIIPPEEPPLAPQIPLNTQANNAQPQMIASPNEIVSATGNRKDRESSAPQNTYIVNHYYSGSSPQTQRQQVTSAESGFPSRADYNCEERYGIQEKGVEKSQGEKKRKLRGCIKREKFMTKKKKRLLCGIAATLVLLIILIIVLTMTLTRKGDKMTVQSQWLNITGFPPIPTGISTIVQPDAVLERSGCVQPTTMWSCSLPKEQQDSIIPNDPDQPNFRVEIRFRNDTSNRTSPSAFQSTIPNPNPVSAGAFVRRTLLHTRNTFTNSLFSPDPSPPNKEDQVFLGNTTDAHTAPFDGEQTPFFISLLSASKFPLAKRQSSLLSNSTNPFPDIPSGIPPPDLNSDGTAAPANLYPFPTAQPLRLYDRSLPTEHYGFYTYYDRSIFLRSSSVLNTSTISAGNVPDDQNGGSEESAATVRCTWRQTRFLVQIWTNRANAVSLLQSPSNTSTTGTASNGNKQHGLTNSKNATKSSANDFIRPGSFPYPVTITLDRHGGDAEKKFIFCYGLDDRRRILATQQKVQIEDRAFGGSLINPAGGIFSKRRKGNDDRVGVDGGTGGCGCQWKNWEGNG